MRLPDFGNVLVRGFVSSADGTRLCCLQEAVYILFWNSRRRALPCSDSPPYPIDGETAEYRQLYNIFESVVATEKKVQNQSDEACPKEAMEQMDVTTMRAKNPRDRSCPTINVRTVQTDGCVIELYVYPLFFPRGSLR